MTKNHLLTLSLLLGLTACSNSSDSPADNGVVIPTSLGFQKPAVGPELTKEQIAEMKTTFKGKEKMTLPPGDLVFPDKKELPEVTEKKEQELAAKDPNSYALMLDLRENCAKGHLNFQADATFPTEQLNEKNAYDLLKKGDRISYSVGQSLVNKANCPVDLGGSTSLNSEVKEVDREARSVSASGGLGAKLNFVMKNPKYAQLLNTRGIIIDTNLSGLGIRRELENGTKDHALVTFNVTGSYLSLKSDIPYNISYKVLAQGGGKEDQKVEIVFDATLQFQGFKANLVGHTTQVNGQAIASEIYLNGRSVTQEELQKIFDDHIPGQESQQQLTRALLN